MAQIARLIGGAGTGKTTELMNIMDSIIDRGVEIERIGFVSFTRAARLEALNRAIAKYQGRCGDLEMNGWFRTLHSVCYRALGINGDALLTDNKESREWFAKVGGDGKERPNNTEYGDWEYSVDGSPTAKSLFIWNLARQKVVTLDVIYNQLVRVDPDLIDFPEVQKFVEDYERQKYLDDRLDFVDLLARFAGIKFTPNSIERVEPAGQLPGLPVWFFDEAQDNSPLLFEVCNRLANDPQCRWAYYGGDPMQSIYGFMGADPSCFMKMQFDKTRTMPQSFRCPPDIHELGETILSGCTDYFDRGIAPASHEGTVKQLWISGAVTDNPAQIITRDRDSKWLIIARTNRVCAMYAAMLNAASVPWVPTHGNGGWQKCKRFDAQMILTELESGAPIEAKEWLKVIDQIKSRHDGEELLERGTKKIWHEDKFKPDSPIASAVPIDGVPSLAEWGATDKLIGMIQKGHWTILVDRGAEFRNAWQADPNEVLNPRVRLGTIHSAKGMQEDNVIVDCRSTKKCADSQRISEQASNEERRVGYVAVTRAKHQLVLLKPRNGHRLPI